MARKKRTLSPAGSIQNSGNTGEIEKGFSPEIDHLLDGRSEISVSSVEIKSEDSTEKTTADLDWDKVEEPSEEKSSTQDCREKNFLDQISESIVDGTEINIFTHKYPDPDAIGSMMAIQWAIEKMAKRNGVKPGAISLIYDGEIAHPQNQVMCNLLDPGIVEATEISKDRYDRWKTKREQRRPGGKGPGWFNILVDTVPDNAGTGGKDVIFDFVVDHHKALAEASDFVYLREQFGSCCAIIYDLIKKCGLEFDDESDTDRMVATAIMVGVSTDTEGLCAGETTENDVKTWSDLLSKRDDEILKRILKFARPRTWVEKRSQVVPKAIGKLKSGVVVVGLGTIDSKDRDLIADVADDIIGWEEVHTSVVFALIDGRWVEGSVRSMNSSTNVPQFCKNLGAERMGGGGGKSGKGAYKYDLGAFALDITESEEIKKKTWELVEEREEKRIERRI